MTVWEELENEDCYAVGEFYILVPFFCWLIYVIVVETFTTCYYPYLPLSTR
jgi:hypothetical protein